MGELGVFAYPFLFHNAENKDLAWVEIFCRDLCLLPLICRLGIREISSIGASSAAIRSYQAGTQPISPLNRYIKLAKSLYCSFRDGKASNHCVIRIEINLEPDYSSQIYQIACPSARPHPGPKNKSRSKDCQRYIPAREQCERAQ